MSRHRVLGAVAGSALLAGLALAGLAPAAPGPDKAPKIRVVLIDGQNNHNWRATTPLLRKQLEMTGAFTVAVSSHTKTKDEKPAVPDAVPFPPDLSKYDVLLSNYNGAPWPKEFQEDLSDRVKAGKLGLVIVHAANNAFSGWREYNLMIGLGWRGSAFGERLVFDDKGKEVHVPKGKGPGAGHGAKHAFKVVVRDASHPVTKGMPREWMHAPDELYHGLRGPLKGVRVLATAYSDKKTRGTGEHEPMIWTVAYGKGRVFHTPMGHDLDGMRCWGFVGTLQRGTEWAATGKVTLPLPEKFPTADKTSSMPAK